MTNKSSYALVGAFVLALGGIFIWGVLWISAGGRPQSFDRYLVYMTDSVSGLNVDAPLKFRGVDVGKVEEIVIDSRNPERIRLLLQVRQGTPITNDTVATLEYQGLTGIANVNLSGGRSTSPPLTRKEGEDYPVIAARTSIFASLDQTLPTLLANVAEISDSINAMLSADNVSKVSRAVDNIALVSDRFAEQSRQLESVIGNLGATLENARTASVGLPELIRQFSQSAQAITRAAGQIGGIGESLSAASSGIESTVAASREDVLDFTSSTLPEITAMVFELRLVAENLRRLSEALAENPSVLLYGSALPEPGPGE